MTGRTRTATYVSIHTLLVSVVALMSCTELAGGPEDRSTGSKGLVTEEVDDMGAQNANLEIELDGGVSDVAVGEDLDWFTRSNPCPTHVIDENECRAIEGCRVFQGRPLEVGEGTCAEAEGVEPLALCGRSDVNFINNYPPQEWIYWREVAGEIEYVKVLAYSHQLNDGWTFCGLQATEPLFALVPPPTHDGIVLEGCNPTICFMGPIL